MKAGTNLDGVRFHDLRHTFATQLVVKNVGGGNRIRTGDNGFAGQDEEDE